MSEQPMAADTKPILSTERRQTARRWLVRLALSPAPLLLLPLLYLVTMARGLVIGDPAEYTFVAHVLGIAHPPGYAFITLVGKLFQTLIPLGDIPWRTHLVSVTVASAAASAVYAIVHRVALVGRKSENRQIFLAQGAALFAAFSVGFAVNQWQHALHTNPHIISAAFVAANLALLTRWWQLETLGDAHSRRPLLLFAFVTGLGVTHHPLTVFAFPAYTAFILAVRPRLLLAPKTLLAMIGAAVLGLAVWLYFPIRSPMGPVFGPSDMNTWDGFLNVALARGLRVNLFFFGLADQPARALVFWSLLRVQQGLPTIALAVVGAGWLWRRNAPGVPSRRPLLLLYGLAFLGMTLFVINTVQDVMAYLLAPFLLVGLFAGIGFFGLADMLGRRLPDRELSLLLGALALLGPVLLLARNGPRVSLRDYAEGRETIQTVTERFAGSGEGAVLLNDWEHMTPLWYARYVEDWWPAPEDVRPQFVSTARPWLPSVFDTLPGGPVYLSGYRPEIVAAGFRLRPSGPYFQVVEPGDTTVPDGMIPLPATGTDVAIIAYNLPKRTVRAGEFVPLTLAMRAAAETDEYFAPVLKVGDLSFPFTTDSHLVTPLWQAGEVIVERFDFALPHDLPEGELPVTVALQNLSQGGALDPAAALGRLNVTPQAYPPVTTGMLANFRQRVALADAAASVGGERRQAPWQEPLPAAPGDVVKLNLLWESLARAEESYTVFVHLIDAADRPLVALDYTPLGGAAPTHLWIPKWLPDQRYLDPYRLQIPPDLLPGTYFIEVGLYEMTSARRLHIADDAGNLVGDRFILGTVRVDVPE